MLTVKPVYTLNMFFLYFCVFQLVFPVVSAYTFTQEENLRTELFVTNSYNKHARPSTNTVITVQLNLLALKELNIKEQYFSVIGYFSIVWMESDRLRWNTNPAFSSIQYIFSTENEIWVPPAIIENSVDNIGVLSYSALRIRLKNDGKVTWTPTDIFTTNCVTDATYYPFDIQTCDIVLSSWGYTKIELDFKVDKKVPLGMTNYKENGEWEYVSYSVSKTIVYRETLQFSQITYSLTFKRRPQYHIFNTVIPMISISLLACFVFKLPADAGEKVGYSLTILLTSAVYLILISDSIPETSLTTPYLSSYLVGLLALDVVSVVLTVVVLELHHTSNEKPIPKCLHVLILKVMGNLVCWKSTGKSCCGSKKVSNDDKVTDLSQVKRTLSDEESNNVTWQDLSIILDIFCFRLYVISMVGLTVGFLLFMLL